MTKSQRMKPLKRLADNREQEAARALAKAERALREAEKTLSDIESYRGEYNVRWRETAAQAAGLPARALREYQAFLDRLDQAMGQQRGRIELCRKDFEFRRQAWIATRRKTQTFDKAIERFQHQERRVEDKREQGDTDERGQRYNGGDRSDGT